MDTAAVEVEQHAQGCTVRVGGLVTEALVSDLRRLSRDMRSTKLDLRAAWLSTEGAEALRHWHRVAQGGLELVLPDTVATLVNADAVAERATSAGAGGELQTPVDLPALLAHELRGPLTVAHLRLQTLTARLGTQGLADEAASCRSALAGLDAVSRLFETYITASRPWTMGSVDLLELCRDAAADARELTAHGRVTVHAIPPDAALWVTGERQALRQLIWNLVRNGLEAGEAHPDVQIDLRRHSAGVEIIVTDVGPGFPDEVLAAPFAPIRSRKASGMGIGLVLCRWIADRHRGQIALGRGERGAMVRVVLPAAVPPAATPDIRLAVP